MCSYQRSNIDFTLVDTTYKEFFLLWDVRVYAELQFFGRSYNRDIVTVFNYKVEPRYYVISVLKDHYQFHIDALLLPEVDK